MNECETCLFYQQDEVSGEYICTALWDQDEYQRFSQLNEKACPYYRNGDDYTLVRRQN